jgi:hypothetical protein
VHIHQLIEVPDDTIHFLVDVLAQGVGDFHVMTSDRNLHDRLLV